MNENKHNHVGMKGLAQRHIARGEKTLAILNEDSRLIRTARWELGMTQPQLAAEIGISQVSLRYWETRCPPKKGTGFLALLERLLILLNRDVETCFYYLDRKEMIAAIEKRIETERESKRPNGRSC